jgi:hypothetical protein
VETSDLVEQIATELRPDHLDQATWLTERAVALRSADELERAQAVEALRSVIHGMGGLVDIDVEPPRRERLDLLVDELWKRLRPTH